MVVGDAVCPCVRDSMGTLAEPSARPVMASVTCTEERALMAGASLTQTIRAPPRSAGAKQRKACGQPEPSVFFARGSGLFRGL